MAMRLVGGGAQDLGVARGTIQIDASSLNAIAAVASGVAAKTKKELGTIDAAVKNTEASFTRVAKLRPMGTGGTSSRQMQIPGLEELPKIGANITTALGGLEAAVARLEARLDQMGESGKRALDKVKDGAEKTESRITRLSNGIGKMQAELVGLSIGAGLLVGAGLRAAGAFENAEVLLQGIAGGIKEGNALMEQLRQKAKAAAVPFSDILNASTQLLPTFEGNTKKLNDWLDIARRVAVLRPSEGMQGAAFSLNEMLGSVKDGNMDLISLADRFSISKSAFREAMKEFDGDALRAMDSVLNKMGITADTSERMAETFTASFAVAKDAVTQLLAVGFTPLLQALTPLLQASADYLSTLRETNPEILALGAGLITVAAVGAPALLLFNQLVEAGTKLKALGILSGLGGAALKAGVYGGAAYAGGSVGLGLARGIGTMTGDERVANTEWSDIGRAAEQAIYIVVAKLTEFVMALRTAEGQVVNGLYQMVASMLNAAAGFVRGIGALLPAGMGGKAFTTTASGVDVMADIARAAGRAAQGSAAASNAGTRDWLRGWGERIQGATGAAAGSPTATTAGATGAGGFTGDQTKAITDWANAVQAIERQAATARLDATAQFERQRSETIANYERGIARDQEDFARSRARAAEQLNRQIADIREAGAKREAEWAESLAESTAEIRAEGNERLADLERNYQRDRERSASDHRDRLLNAAGRLDAVAVREEQRRYANQERDAAEAFEERSTTERDNLAERLQQEQESHQERLEAAREADEQRIVELRDSLAESQRLENEDRAIAAQRREEDHQRQLQQQAEANAQRLAQIDQQAAEERKALDADFLAQLSALDLHNKQYIALQQAKQDQSLKLFDQWWGGVNKRFAEQGARPEWSSTASLTSGGIDMLGGRSVPIVEPTFPATFNEAASRARGSTVTFGEGSIQVYATPSQSEEQIARLVRDEMITLLEGAQ